jgi:peroxiredoxin (alkyl hydroperoxide reductase subunit C)
MYSIGDIFPDFELPSCDADNNLGITKIPDDDGKWHVFYFYPKDFTFICPTEIKAMDRLVKEDCHVLGFSGDNEFCKLNWKENNDLIKDIKHTLVADTGLRLSTELGIVDEENGVCFRATFICNPDNVIQHVSCNALDTGRNVSEVIRTLKALKTGELTGCSWNPGDIFLG